MGIEITHEEALRLAGLTGSLVTDLFGRPDLVVGIARSGIPVARAFADGSGAAACVTVTKQRTTSVGWRGKARDAVRAVTPRFARRTYKHLFFKSTVRIARRGATTALADDDCTELREALGDGPAFVVLVDDAIDSGKTMASVVATLERLNPDGRLLAFALTSTTGCQVAPLQLNVFGDLVDYVEGDLAHLSASRADELVRRVASWHAEDRTNGAAAVPRNLYVEVEGTLVPDPLRSITRALLAASGPATRLRIRAGQIARRLLRRPPTPTHEAVGELVENLDDRAAEELHHRLVGDLRARARWPVTELARASAVRCRLLTRTLPFCRSALEAAFGVPVLTVDPSDGDTLETVVLDRDRHAPGAPTLLLGHVADEHAAVERDVESVTVPEWDRTGVMAVLGVTSWWRRR